MGRKVSEDVLEVIKTRDLKAEAEADAEVQMLLKKKMVKANDIIRLHIEGKLDLETCVGMLMMKYHNLDLWGKGPWKMSHNQCNNLNINGICLLTKI